MRRSARPGMLVSACPDGRRQRNRIPIVQDCRGSFVDRHHTACHDDEERSCRVHAEFFEQPADGLSDRRLDAPLARSFLGSRDRRQLTRERTGGHEVNGDGHGRSAGPVSRHIGHSGMRQPKHGRMGHQAACPACGRAPTPAAAPKRVSASPSRESVFCVGSPSGVQPRIS